jgi:hypothetical protein
VATGWGGAGPHRKLRADGPHLIFFPMNETLDSNVFKEIERFDFASN